MGKLWWHSSAWNKILLSIQWCTSPGCSASAAELNISLWDMSLRTHLCCHKGTAQFQEMGIAVCAAQTEQLYPLAQCLGNNWWSLGQSWHVQPACATWVTATSRWHLQGHHSLLGGGTGEGCAGPSELCREAGTLSLLEQISSPAISQCLVFPTVTS